MQRLHGKQSVDKRMRLGQNDRMERFTEQTAVRLDKPTAEKLSKIAQVEDRSVSQVIRRMVADAVAAYKLPSAPKPARKP
jgi:Ribbon-helix-helix protein, copG family